MSQVSGIEQLEDEYCRECRKLAKRADCGRGSMRSLDMRLPTATLGLVVFSLDEFREGFDTPQLFCAFGSLEGFEGKSV